MASPLSAEKSRAVPKAGGLAVREYTGWTTHNHDSATGKPRGALARLIGAARPDSGVERGHVTRAAGTNLTEASLVKLDHLGNTGKTSLAGLRIRGSLLIVVA